MKRLILISYCLFLVNCGDKSTVSKTEKIEKIEETDSTNRIISLKEDTVKILETTTAKPKPKAFLIDERTNFDNFKKLNELSSVEISNLQLKEIEPNFTHFYFCYNVPFSEDFKTIAITMMHEMEMSTYLITYDKNSKKIDRLKVAYDEIAESAFRTESVLRRDLITITNSDYMMHQTPTITTEYYKVLENGKFKKRNQ